MRVFDLNDCYIKDEVDIYRRKTNVNFILLSIVFAILLFALSSTENNVKERLLILASMIIIGILLYYSRTVHYYKSDEVLLTISKNGVKYNSEVFTDWKNIEDERIEIITEEDVEIEYLIYYCKNINRYIRINSSNLSVDSYTVLRAFDIFRNRKAV